MAEHSTTHPHIIEPHAPLAHLIQSALRRYGEFNAATIDGDVALLFVDLANMVIEDLRAHPYWEGGEISYYLSQDEARPIPDQIMINGLLAHFAVQQLSQKAQLYVPLYQHLLSQILWERKHGNKPIELNIVDGGTNRRNSRVRSGATGSTTRDGG